MSGVPIVHFDAHPDLLLPLHMQADDVFDREKLYSGLSIENWILPLVYAGHIGEIYWLKPPWADQIPDALHRTFSVGKWKQTGEIRMTLDDPYFLTEALYAPECQLTDVKSVTLHVITVTPHNWTEGDVSGNPGNSLRHTAGSSINNSECNSDCAQTGVLETPAPTEQLQLKHQGPSEAKRTKVDLESSESAVRVNNDKLTEVSENINDDALETDRAANYDKSAGETIQQGTDHSESEHTCNEDDKAKSTITASGDGSSCDKLLLNQRWVLELQENLQGKPFVLDIDLDFYSTKDPFRNECSSELTALLQQLFGFKLPTDTSQQGVMAFSEARRTQLDELDAVFQQLYHQPDCTPKVKDPCRQQLLHSLLALLQSDKHQSGPVDFEMLYRAGCTFDGTALPHHVSSPQQIQWLMDTTAAVLKSLPKPTIVTVSRSSVDDYCPQDQVDAIQDDMLRVFDEVYKVTEVKKLYKEQQ
ncbi:UPF0489 protein C5orf22-like isoform X2 [Littorina saxatilis]